MTIQVCIVGCGYVGFPLALALAKHYCVVGVDKNQRRVAELANGWDSNENFTFSSDKFLSGSISFVHEIPNNLKFDFFIIAVPTPVDRFAIPELDAVRTACVEIGGKLQAGSIVVLESTVFPGVVEDICGPILEEESGLSSNDPIKGFSLAYSPERINPGDKQRSIEDIVKVVAANNAVALESVANLYGSAIKAGVFRAKSIRVAESAKVIENIQRDVNIALMNELSVAFRALGIEFRDVLKAAGTKWNFLNFTPGLVGGHCIGVDPYYLMHKVKEQGIHLSLVESARRVNNEMVSIWLREIIKVAISVQKKSISEVVEVLIFGYTFKPNCSDTRNTKVKVLGSALESWGYAVKYCDPLVNINLLDPSLAEKFISFEDAKVLLSRSSGVAVFAVDHDEFKSFTIKNPEKINSKFSWVDLTGNLHEELVTLSL